MTEPERPAAIVAAEAPPRARPSTYTAVFARLTEARAERPPGDLSASGISGST